MKTSLLAALVAIAACACHRDGAPAAGSASTAPAPGLNAWTLPAGPGSGQPDLQLTSDGRLLLSWLETQAGRRTRFQYGEQAVDAPWQGPKTIAIGSSFVVNWADKPHLVATPDGALWVQWLQQHDGAPDAYDIAIANSRDGGMNWSAPLRPHAEGTASEHGFVSLWAQGDDRLGIAWLDGRASAGAHGEGGTHHAGATDLRSATYDNALQGDGETEIDARACDCCQTDVAVTTKGPLLVYRDRSEDEIRDIVATRHDGSAWRATVAVHADQWKMTACPVNGPAVAAQGNAAIVGWYTGAGDAPAVQLARTADAGDTFAAPRVLDRGDAVQGRIDVALDRANAWALWVREDARGQSLWLARLAPDLSREHERVEVAKLKARGRGTGFPQLAVRNGNAYIVWTDIVDKVSSLHGAVYVPAGG